MSRDILIITGEQGTGKSQLADFIECIAQSGRQPLLIVDPFDPRDAGDMDEIVLFDGFSVLVTNLDQDSLYKHCPRRDRSKLDNIIARATRITLGRP